MHLQSVCLSYGGDGETLEHVLFMCPWACQICRSAGLDGLIFRIEDPLSAFLELLRQYAGSHRTRAIAIRATYIAYHIWLSRNTLVFDSRSCPMRIILQSACMHTEEIPKVTLKTTKTWGLQLARVATR